MTVEEIKRLHAACTYALSRYMAEAEKTCRLMDQLAQPVTFKDWERVLEQRLRENDAHEAYQHARQWLFNMLRPAS